MPGPVTLPTLPADTHYTIKTSFERLKTNFDELSAQHAALVARVGQIPPVPTMAQIAQALSAGGSNPLNLTNLTGSPASPPGTSSSPSPPPNPPPQPPYGSPCGPRAEHTDTVAQAKADLIAMGTDISGDCGAFAIVQLVVQRLAASGEAIGTSKKLTGRNCNGHSVQLVVYADGEFFDILQAAGNTNGPQWNFQGIDVTLYEGAPCP